MLAKNADVIVSNLLETDVVLDIGGWGHPFNRANWIMDIGSYDTRGAYNKTWANHSPCS
jgi:hypothetical protein